MLTTLFGVLCKRVQQRQHLHITLWNVHVYTSITMPVQKYSGPLFLKIKPTRKSINFFWEKQCRVVSFTKFFRASWNGLCTMTILWRQVAKQTSCGVAFDISALQMGLQFLQIWLSLYSSVFTAGCRAICSRKRDVLHRDFSENCTKYQQPFFWNRWALPCDHIMHIATTRLQ